MGEAVVRHVRQDGEPPKILQLRINGPGANFLIGTEKISQWSLTQPGPQLLDLIDIAGAVFAADRRIRRGHETRPDLGRDWRRQLDFRISVRCPDFWAREDVTEALRDAVSFLTDDDVSFAFEPTGADAPSSDYLPLAAPGAGPMGAGQVILFSGGLDSLAGAVEVLKQTDENVILVTHRSSQKMITFQNDLAERLEEDNPGRVRRIAINATFTKMSARESTQRSRSFLFAAFGYVIARLVGAGHINFFENGVVSHQLPISPQVIGTMATRTTHPCALAKFEHLLSLIDGSRFQVRNPFAWRTKTEVVKSLRDNGAEDYIRGTSSCNHVWKRTTDKTHCGACSQCLDRRFAILAAGLADADPESSYETPVLTGAHEKDLDQTMVVDWARHALRLADISEADFATRFMGELSRIVGNAGGLSSADTLRRCHDLQKRHGTAVKRVLVDQSRAHIEALLDRSLPENALLRVVMADQTGGRMGPQTSPVEVDPRPPFDDLDRDHGYEEAPLWPLKVALYRDGKVPVIDVRGLGTVHGMPAAPAHALRPQFEDDCREGREPKEHRFVSPGSLCPEAGKTPNAVAKNVQRCREQLAEYYVAIEGAHPETDLLIESASWAGYRLEPTTRIVSRDED